MTLARQALILTLGNGLTRGLGFILRLLLARWMGAEALGVMEMANSVGMLALTPVTAGIPAAMSRLTAKQAAIDRPNVLRAGLHLVTRTALWLIPALLLLAPCFAWLLGDMRTLPAILLNAPDILPLPQHRAIDRISYRKGVDLSGFKCHGDICIGIVLSKLRVGQHFRQQNSLKGSGHHTDAGVCQILNFDFTA